MLWDADSDAMSASLALHNELFDDAIGSHGGHVVKTIGDAYMAAFARPIDAIESAVDAQRKLAAVEWGSGPALSVRIGIHTGTAELIDGDYFGPDVNRAARIEAAGHGGQILVTAATRELAAAALAGELRAVDLGRHELRGMDRSEQIFQITAPGLRDEFPPLRTAEAGALRGLPTYPTSFVGRATELADLIDLLAGPARMVSLVGQGGTGKTRLATEATSAAAPSFPNGAVYCSLTAAQNEDHVVTAVLDVAGLAVDTHTSDLSPKVQLLDYLSNRSLLVVLDNFEHLLDAVGLISDLVNAGPGVKVLVTSRERLRLTGEAVYHVGSLDDGDHSVSADLFADRARLLDPTFELDPVRSDVEMLCARLGGLPLGIEMAAAWADMLSPAEIVSEIDRSLDFLESEEADRPDHHRSLRAVFDASWHRLTDAEQRALRRLTVFRGGFDKDAARQVASADLKVLSSLVAKSLVNRPQPGRFDMHPLIHEFAAEALGDDESAELLQGHANYFRQVLLDHRAALDGADQADARDRLRTDVDNLRAALLWTAKHGPAHDIVGMLEAVYLFFLAHSWHEGIGFFRQLAEATRSRTEAGFDAEYVAASVVGTVSYLRAWIGELDDALRTGHDAAEVLERHETGLALAMAWASIGAVHVLRGEHPEALRYLERARTAIDPDEHASLYALLCTTHGWSFYEQGEYERASEVFTEGLEVARRTGAVLAEAYSISKLGLSADEVGDYSRAIDLHHQGREAFVKLGDPAGEADKLRRLAMTYLSLGDFETSREFALEGLLGFERINHRWGTLASMSRLGMAEVGLGELDSAEARFRSLIDKSIEFTMPATGRNYGWTGLAQVAEARGDQETAVQVLAWLAIQPDMAQSFTDKFIQPSLDRLQTSLGDESFGAAKAAGQAFDSDRVAGLLGLS